MSHEQLSEAMDRLIGLHDRDSDDFRGVAGPRAHALIGHLNNLFRQPAGRLERSLVQAAVAAGGSAERLLVQLDRRLQSGALTPPRAVVSLADDAPASAIQAAHGSPVPPGQRLLIPDGTKWAAREVIRTRAASSPGEVSGSHEGPATGGESRKLFDAVGLQLEQLCSRPLHELDPHVVNAALESQGDAEILVDGLVAASRARAAAGPD